MIPVADIPLKCAPETAANVPNNPCKPPGSQARCLLCPASPTYHRRDELAAPKEVIT